MLRHFTSLVVCKREAHIPIKALQDITEVIGSCLSGAIIELDQCHIKGGAFDHGANLKTVAGTLDVVTFPMPRHQTLSNVSRTLINTNHVGNLSTSIATAGAWRRLL